MMDECKNVENIKYEKTKKKQQGRSLETQQQNKWCNEKEEQKLNWPNEAEKEIENKCCVDAS